MSTRTLEEERRPLTAELEAPDIAAALDWSWYRDKIRDLLSLVSPSDQEWGYEAEFTTDRYKEQVNLMVMQDDRISKRLTEELWIGRIGKLFHSPWAVSIVEDGKFAIQYLMTRIVILHRMSHVLMGKKIFLQRLDDPAEPQFIANLFKIFPMNLI